jgi:hypothetical protein
LQHVPAAPSCPPSIARLNDLVRLNSIEAATDFCINNLGDAASV